MKDSFYYLFFKENENELKHIFMLCHNRPKLSLRHKQKKNYLKKMNILIYYFLRQIINDNR